MHDRSTGLLPLVDAGGDVIGKVGRVTGRVGPGLVGEIMVSVRGGSEAFPPAWAWPASCSGKPDAASGNGAVPSPVTTSLQKGDSTP